METTTKPSRSTNPEYAALRDAAEAARPDYEAAAADLVAVIRENPWMLNDLADQLVRWDQEILTGHRQAIAFVAARAPYGAARAAQVAWIDAHPEYR